MADLDLRRLSAPLEELRSEVDEAYKRLDGKWKAVAEYLNSVPIPCTVSFIIKQDPYDPTEVICLEWRKWKGSKRVCIASYFLDCDVDVPQEAESVIPFDEWSGEQRVDMLKHVPALFQAAVKQTKAFIDLTKE